MLRIPSIRCGLLALAVAALPFLAPAQDDPDLQLLAYWDFEGNATNGVGGEDEERAGEVTGGAEFVPDGKYGDGMNFDAGPATLHVADASFINEAAAKDKLTIVFWQQNTSAVRDQSAFWAVSPSSDTRGAQAHTPWSNNNIYFDTAGCCDAATQRINQAWDGDWDEWNHFTFVKDGEDKRIYVNGEEFLAGTNTAPLPEDFTELWIGSAVGGSNSLPGTLDEFGIFAGILSAEEIERLYTEDGLLVSDLVKFIDEDGDLMHDSWEERNGLDPTVDDSALDPDGDTLTNVMEYTGKPRTNPNSADTDDDGITDQFETNTGVWNGPEDTGTSPVSPDSDSDGLSDGVENPDLPYIAGDPTQPGTDPNNPDTDGDGARDGLEVAGNVSDPTNSLDVASNQFPGGNWTVQHVWTESDQIGDVEAAEAALNGEVALRGDITVEHPYIHFHDNAGPPWFGDQSVPFPLWDNEEDGFGARDDFAIRVTGQFFIKSSGLATFVCNSDDGFSLRIDGEEVGSAGNRGRGNTEMEVDLDAGVHDLEFIYWERGGGAGVTVSIHRGVGNAPAPDGDNFELLQAFNPHEVVTQDTDGDGIDDFKETFFFDTLARDGSEDFDEDGLTDGEEFELKVDPNNKDHDGDGLEDGPEVTSHGTDPANADTDGDSLADGAEINEHGTDPTKADTDDDTFDDNIELALGTNPNEAASRPEAIIAVNKGPWDAGSTWSDGQVPSAGNDYVVVNTVMPTLESGSAFGGDKLTIIGPNASLAVGHLGVVRVPELIAQQALFNVSRATTGLGGALRFEGPNIINTSGGTLDLRSRLSGDGPVTVTSGSAADQIGGVILGGIGNDYHGGWTVIGTALTVNTHGAAGSGPITLFGGRLTANADIYAPESTLDIGGDGFGLHFNGTVVFQDLRGIDPGTGNEIFRLSELAPPGVTEFTIADLRSTFGVDESSVSGTGVFQLAAGNPDADGDGMPDSWEEANLGGVAGDPDGDEDGDNLGNLWEFRTGSDPNNADTDGDGLPDGDEIAVNSDPLVTDTDGDELSDAEEAACGSDPNNDRDVCGDVPVVPYKLLGYWDFNDPSNPEVTASLVGGINAQLRDGAAFSEDGGGFTGMVGDFSLDFGDTSENQHAVIEDASFMNPAGDDDQLSISFFQKLDAVANTSSFWLLGEGAGGDRAFQAHVPWGDSTIHFDSAGCCDAPAQQRISASAEDTVFTEWHHFAFVKDGPDKTVWIDGERFLQGRNTGILPSPFTQLFIGSATSGGNSLQGVLDEFAVFQGVLDEEAIGKLALGVPANNLEGEPPVVDPGEPGTITGVFVSASGIAFSFPEGATYDVEYSINLQTWTVIASDVGGVYEDTDAARTAAGIGFYRGVLK